MPAMTPNETSVRHTSAARTHDPARFRRVLGHYPTGVAVVTAADQDGNPEGMVVGSFTSVSLDPPLVAFLPAASSASWAKIRPAGRFCINILGADHEQLCRRFTARGLNKYDGVSWTPGPSGSPVIDGAVAWIDCQTDTIHSAGDHDIVVGRVLDLETASEGLPLLFFRGGYGSFTPRTMIASDEAHTTEIALIDRARHLLEGSARAVRGQVAVVHCDGENLTVLAAAGQARNPHVDQAAIGETVALRAPIGIWWMSQAAPDVVRDWIEPLGGPQRELVRDALELIREDGGLTVGLADVHDGMDQLLAERAGPDRRTAAQEAATLSGLAGRPMDYVASRFGPYETTADHPEVRSIWSPVRHQDGHVVFGVMATGFPPDHSLADVTEEVRHLAAGIATLTRDPSTATTSPRAEQGAS